MQVFFSIFFMSKTKFEKYIINSIRQKRKSENLSQAKIAKILAVTPGFIGQIEMEETSSMYSFDHLNRLAIHFNCSPRDFFPLHPILDKH